MKNDIPRETLAMNHEPVNYPTLDNKYFRPDADCFILLLETTFF